MAKAASAHGPGGAIVHDARELWAQEQCAACGSAGPSDGPWIVCVLCHEAYHVPCGVFGPQDSGAPPGCQACATRRWLAVDGSALAVPASPPAPLTGPMLRLGATAVHANPVHTGPDGVPRAFAMRRVCLAGGSRAVASVWATLVRDVSNRLRVAHVHATLLAPIGPLSHAKTPCTKGDENTDPERVAPKGAVVYSGAVRGPATYAITRMLGLDVLCARVHAASLCAVRPASATVSVLRAPAKAPPARPMPKALRAATPKTPHAARQRGRPPAQVRTAPPCARLRVYRRDEPRVRAHSTLPRVDARTGAPLYVGRSRIAGLGLFAAAPIAAGTPIATYVGELLAHSDALIEAREQQYARDPRLGGTLYLFRLDARRVVDATRKGGHARFANHSCAPNAEAVARGRAAIVIRMLRAVAAGDEITFDYRVGGRGDGRAMRCLCNSSECRGTLDE